MTTTSPQNESETHELSERVLEIPISLINDPIHAMRKAWDSDKMHELIESIREHGVQTPICVRRTEDNRYEVVYGHRRLLASQNLRKATIPAIIRDLDDRETAIARAHENFKREDVTAIDEGHHFQDLIDNAGYQLSDLVDMVGKSESYVRQRLEAIGWSANIQEAIEDGEVSFSVAREIARVNDERVRDDMLYDARYNGATVQKISTWKRSIDRAKAIVEPPPSLPTNGNQPAPTSEGMLLCDVTLQLYPASKIHMIRVSNDAGGKDVVDWIREALRMEQENAR